MDKQWNGRTWKWTERNERNHIENRHSIPQTFRIMARYRCVSIAILTAKD